MALTPKDDPTLLYMIQKTVLSKFYPVGSIYMSLNPENPGKLFGGKWERIQDRFLLAAGENHEPGAEGGSEDAVIPYHTHTTETGGAWTFNTRAIGRGSAAAQVEAGTNTTVDATHVNQRYLTSNNNTTTSDNAGTTVVDRVNHAGHSHTVNYAGTSGNTAGANMPPYLAVYVWKRTE